MMLACYYASVQAHPTTGPERSFDILAAVDLLDGGVVRLRGGRFEGAIRYNVDPIATVEAWIGAGAGWLHVVDLAGARTGAPVEASMIEAICRAVGDRARVEVGGGLRTAAAIGRVLEQGATRVVIGSAGLTDPDLVATIVARHGTASVVVALDVRAGRAIGDGWRAGTSGLPVEVALERLADAGAETFEVTAVDRDGSLGGPDVELLRRLVVIDRGGIIASGGIAGRTDITKIVGAGCQGAIIGRALYEGRLTIADALAAAVGR